MTAAIIVAAGKGTRMGPGIDKIFLEVAGQPLVAHTWNRFDSHPLIEEIVIVIRSGMENAFKEIAAQLRLSKPFRFASGGPERQHSVWNGLQALHPKTEIVAVQDGARPCTSPDLISDTIAAARRIGAAVAAQKVTDTLKEAAVDLTISRNVDRSKLWAVQTPQVFRVPAIRRALSQVIETGLLVTDDTAACELIGQPVQLVESNAPNPKATTPADLPFIESLLKSSTDAQH